MSKLIYADKLALEYRRHPDRWYFGRDVLREISEAEAVYAEQPTANGWISVKDATPDKDGVYLTWHGQSPMIQAFGLTGADLIGMNTWIEKKGGWVSIEMNRPIVGITYWQPLPEPPKEDDHEAD